MPHKTGSEEAVDPASAKKLLQESTDKPSAEKVAFWFSKRFCVVVLLFFGNMNVVLLKMNLNIAIVEMTSKKNITANNVTITYEPEYSWDSKTIGFIQSAYAYGLPFCAVGIPMIKILGGTVTVGTTILAMAVINLLTPASLYVHFWLFFASRIVLGVLDGATYMGTLEMLSRWVPVRERSTLMSFCLCGIYIGVAISYPICGFIANRWGWRTSFYFSGVEGIIWSCIFLIVVRNQPSKDKRMSEKELLYLVENTQTVPRKQVVHPYKEILTSGAVWALCAGKFTYSWGVTMLIMCFPLYVKDMTGRSTDEVGLIASIPNFVCVLAIPFAGIVMDCWQNNSTITITQIHKIVMTIGFSFGSIFFVIASYSTNFILSMICFVLIKSILAFNYLILQLVCLYMSPTHSSILAGLSSCWYTLSIILTPNIVGFIVQKHLLEEWSICFLSSGAVLFVGAVIFLFYGSSELQPWNTSNISDIPANENYKIKNKTDCEA